MSGYLVVDASVLVDSLSHQGDRGEVARARLRGELLAGPEILRVECVNVLRGLVRCGRVPDDLGARAVDRLAGLPIRVAKSSEVLGRVWELRHNLTAYDASYIAVAEFLDARLLTRDKGLSDAPGSRCVVDLL